MALIGPVIDATQQPVARLLEGNRREALCDAHNALDAARARLPDNATIYV
ncbi:hypothetical protein [Corynebacterium sp. H113]